MAKSTARSVRGKGRTRKAKSGRPDKPYPDFPLVAHPAGYWCKKILGKLQYFGRWGKRVNGEMVWVDAQGGWQTALENYKETRDDRRAGRKPRQKGEGATIRDLCSRFLNDKRRMRDNRELSPVTWNADKTVCDRLVDVANGDIKFTPDDAIAKEVRKLLDETNYPKTLAIRSALCSTTSVDLSARFLAHTRGERQWVLHRAFCARRWFCFAEVSPARIRFAPKARKG